MTNLFALVDLLAERHALSHEAYRALVEGQSPELAAYAAKKADAMRREIYGTDVYVRGLIEIGNYCRNDCIYCGIRKSNKNCDRYQLTRKQILECCEEGWNLGFRTFVLQGGEGIVPIVQVCELVRGIKSRYPDCAVTLSLGEYSRADYQAMFDAGADRYLLRHETADKAHYEKLHPASMSFDNRMRCLRDLKEIGYQVGCGFMVGSPYQTPDCLATDLKFIETFQPEMCGIGPFIPQKDTPFREPQTRPSICSPSSGSSNPMSCFLPPRLLAPLIRSAGKRASRQAQMSSCRTSPQYRNAGNTRSTTTRSVLEMNRPSAAPA